ncbi:diguanylate cyclase domain-containing protein [Kineosporia sp. R_H_3]|uniref:diguanylate cyclase domain-containing protein n=1 Tax=Kineosporia sp. R_H_3 TaxID=1961848 RepID=UPI001304310F|nr:GGDEF domain-containing protein [Kineosporia sp. R_H_3]
MRPRTQNKPVAILVDGLADYQQRIVRGVESVLSAEGVASVVVVRHLHEGAASDSVFDLVRPDAVRGVVATSVTEETAHAYVGAFLDQDNPPLVTVGSHLAGVPGVRADNSRATEDLVAHLLATRSVRRPVFLRGAQGNPDSDDRETAVRRLLADGGVVLDDDHVLTGLFEREAARLELTRLLDRDRYVDLVVAANDQMALGAVDALLAAHRRVPEDVGVTGFDDEPVARATRPPLTTVDQCLVEQGERAARLLLARMDGDATSPHEHVPARLVVRRSCGAAPLSGIARARAGQEPVAAVRSRTTAEVAVAAGVDERDAQAIGTDLEAGLASLGAPPVQLPPGWAREWGALALAAVAEDGDPQPWLSHCLPPLWSTAEEGGDMGWWVQAAATLLEAVLVHRPSHSAALRAALLHGELSSRLAEAEHEVWLDARRREIAALDHARGVSEALRSVDSLQDLTRSVVHHLPGLGIRRFFMATFEPEAGAPTASARIVVAYRGNRVDESATGIVFPSAGMLPSELAGELAGGVLVLQPLRVGRFQHGFMLYDQPFSHAVAGDALRRDVSACLDGMARRYELAREQDAVQQVVVSRTRRLTVEALTRSTGRTSAGLSADPLTGLADADGLNAAMTALWLRHEREGRPVAVLVVDVDDLAAYNEAAGHEQGDVALRRVAGVLARAAQRPGDVVARTGGQRFALMLPDTGEAGAAEVARRLHRLVHEAGIAFPGQQGRVLTVSTGVAARVPDLAVEPSEVLEAADHALYLAKELGKDRWAVADADESGWLLDAVPEPFVPKPRETGADHVI